MQSPTSLPLSENDLFQNVQTQYGLQSASFSDLKAIVLTNFTYTIIALDTIDVSPQTLIQTSRFAAYANVTILEGTIDTSSRGCPGGTGIGKGKNANSFCTATGGAYGGFGGASAPIGLTSQDICNHFTSMPYGDYSSFKVIEGSGGGGLSIQQPSDGGAGGGFIWIQSYNLTYNNA